MKCSICKTKMRVKLLKINNGKKAQVFFCPNKNCPNNKTEVTRDEKERITENE